MVRSCIWVTNFPINFNLLRQVPYSPVVDPDLSKEGEGGVLLALPAFRPSRPYPATAPRALIIILVSE